MFSPSLNLIREAAVLGIAALFVSVGEALRVTRAALAVGLGEVENDHRVLASLFVGESGFEITTLASELTGLPCARVAQQHNGGLITKRAQRLCCTRDNGLMRSDLQLADRSTDVRGGVRVSAAPSAVGFIGPRSSR